MHLCINNIIISYDYYDNGNESSTFPIKLFSSCFQVVFKLFSSCFQVMRLLMRVRTSTYVRLFIGCLVGWYDVILTCLQVIIICELIELY